MFIAIDGNDIGKHIEGLILNGDLDQLLAYSTNISSLINTFEQTIKKQGGKCYLYGGDNILAYIPQEEVFEIIRIVNTFQTEEVSFSIGIGKVMILGISGQRS